MCRGCFNISGMRTKRELLRVLEAERSAGVLYHAPSFYKPSFKEFGTRRIGLRCCASEVCFQVETEESERFNQCSQCKSSDYCSRRCQKADWKKRHKNICAQAAEQREMELKAF